MCTVCYSSPCLPGCPYEEPPRVVAQCSWCGEDIAEGKTFHIQYVNEVVLCDRCKHEMSLSDLNELFDGEIFEALGFEEKEAEDKETEWKEDDYE